MVVGQRHWTVTAQWLDVSPITVYELQHQEPTTHQVVSVMKTGPQHPQTLGHAAMQTAHGHGPALLGDTQCD